MPINATFQGYPLGGRGVTFTRTPGLSPNANSISLAVDGVVVLTSGDMYFSDGSSALTLSDQYAEEFHEVVSDSGRTWRGVIMDKRWQYKFGHITGEYNKPGKDGTPTEEQSLADLAGLLLDAMGEVGYDDSALPADIYPHVRWQHATPADELNRLLQDWGFVAALRNNNNIKVWAKGAGAALPGGYQKRTTTGQKRTRRPDVIVIAGGRSIIQRTFELVPYGLDPDGAWVPLADLSYAPDAGDPDGGFGVDARNAFATGDYTDSERKLARETVFRVYGLADDDRWCLPWLNRIVETCTEDGEVRPKEPVIEAPGAAKPLEWDGQRFAEKPGDTITEGYTIDAEHGLVKFAELMCTADDEDSPTEFQSIDISATVAYLSVADDGTWSDDDFYSYTDGAGDTEMCHRNDNLVLRGIWDDDAEEVVWQNQDALDTYATAWVAQIKDTDEFVTSEEVLYVGIVSIECDGRIKSVTWTVNESGATTVASLNTERAMGRAPTYHERTQTITNRQRLDGSEASLNQDLYASSAEGVKLPSPAPTKTALPASATDRGERRGVLNSSGVEIPAHAAVEFDGWDASAAMLKIKKPTAASLAYWAITDGPIADGKAGQVFVGGHHFVTAAEGVSAGDRVSTQAASHDVAADACGNAYVLAVVTVGGSPEALVAIDDGGGESMKRCTVTEVNGDYTCDVAEVGTSWTQDDVGYVEIDDGDLAADPFCGESANVTVPVVKIGGEWRVLLGHGYAIT